MMTEQSPDHPHDQSASPRDVVRVAVLGSTGSVGAQTLETIAHLNGLFDQGTHPTRYEIVALCARSNTELLSKQARLFPSATVGVCDPSVDVSMFDSSNLIHESSAATRLVESTRPDLVVASIVGIAGLPSTLRAAELGIDIVLANKESLVAAGGLVTSNAIKNGSNILPVDSEHGALWQCLLGIEGAGYTPPSTTAHGSIKRVTLTASGGPFRTSTLQEMHNATPAQALNHPTWSMGSKVTIDSATLINKGLELIEAHWLFGLGADQLDAVIHPQSTVHALVETVDSSIIAHLGPTDMRCPIQHALTHPSRVISLAAPLDLAMLGSLDFEPIDPDRFPSITIAKQVIERGGSAGVVLNAANEAAVDAFLKSQIRFTDIYSVVSRTLDDYNHHRIDSLDAVMDAHGSAHQSATRHIHSQAAR